MKADTQTQNRPELLECTIRDGNYAVNFRFTKADTALFTKQLASLGFKWIEIGHGLGLGGSAAGKGYMPDSDTSIIQAAAEVSGNSKIGCFFIPGVGVENDLIAAREAGLDFIRIGCNASDIQRSFPFIKLALSIGLIPCVNLMKSYSISSEQFRDLAKSAFDQGAHVVYCVDSAGCMLPDQVSSYFEAANPLLSEFNAHLGFHGHNNLMLAIANCLAAYRSGGRFLDTTLYGIGRSAGNAQTEVLVAVLHRLGIDTGIPLFQLMQVAEAYLAPLVSNLQMHSMLNVAIGYGSFHSSFLKSVAAAARKYNADLRQLVAIMGMEDPSSINRDFLEQKASELTNSNDTSTSDFITSFQGTGFTSDRIRTTRSSLHELIEDMMTAAAKKPGSLVGLIIQHSTISDPSLLLTELACEDSNAIIGRLSVGATATLEEVLEPIVDKVQFYLVDSQCNSSRDLIRATTALAGKSKVFPIDVSKMRFEYAAQILNKVLLSVSKPSLLIFGYNQELATVVNSLLSTMNIFVLLPSTDVSELPRGAVRISQTSDWSNTKLDFDAVACFLEPSKGEEREITKGLKHSGTLFNFTLGCQPYKPLWSGSFFSINLDQAFVGSVARLSLLNSSAKHSTLKAEEVLDS